MLRIGETLTITSSFEKAMESHKKLLAERWEKDREMELKQIEENLAGITELVNKLYEEVEKMKQEPKEEEPKKYQLNIYVDKPTHYEKGLGVMHYDNYWYINNLGEVKKTFWKNCILDKCLWENAILFKNKESAETYLELLNDMKRFSKKFELRDRLHYMDTNYNYQLALTEDGTEVSYTVGTLQTRDYYFTQENAEFILNKYGQEVLRNFIRYCK